MGCTTLHSGKKPQKRKLSSSPFILLPNQHRLCKFSDEVKEQPKLRPHVINYYVGSIATDSVPLNDTNIGWEVKIQQESPPLPPPPK